jgi:ketosteroid isomerase-like protein
MRLPNGDVPPTGKSLIIDYVGVQRVSDGKITYLRHYLDVMDLMTPLGLAGTRAKESLS